MSRYNVGVSALDTAQTALNLIGNTLANANTPGYHRQIVDLTEALPTQIGNISVGSGVQISGTRRQIDNLLETAIIQQTFSLANTTAHLNTLRQMQADLSPSSGSLHDTIQQFFNDVNTLATNLADTTQRNVIIQDAHNTFRTCDYRPNSRSATIRMWTSRRSSSACKNSKTCCK